MFKIILVNFPYIDNNSILKGRPALCLTQPFGAHELIIIAYITTQCTEILDTDIEISKNDDYFKETGLLHNSVIKLHKLTTISIHDTKGQIGQLSEKQTQQVKDNIRIIFHV